MEKLKEEILNSVLPYIDEFNTAIISSNLDYIFDNRKMDIERIEQAIKDYEQARESLLSFIKSYCKAERGNMKRLAEKCGMNYQYLSNTLNGSSAKIERLIWIAKKIA